MEKICEIESSLILLFQSEILENLTFDLIYGIMTVRYCMLHD